MEARSGNAPLLWCGVLGVLVLAAAGTFQWTAYTPVLKGAFHLGVVGFAAPGLALVAWRLWPRWAGVGLLAVAGVVGVVIALPALFSGAMPTWVVQVVLLAAAVGPVCALAGVIGVGVSLAQDGATGRAGALIGAALAVELLSPLLVRVAFGHRGTDALAVPGLVLAVALAGVAAVTLARGRFPEVPAPSWAVTIAGAVAAAAPVAYSTGLFTPAGEPVAANLRMVAVFLGVAVVTAFVAGARFGLAGWAAGLLLGSFGALVGAAVVVLRDMVALALVAAVVSLLAGCAAAASRWRLEIGVVGTGVVVIGLAVILVLFASDLPLESYDWFTRGLAPLLMVVGVVAAVALLAALAVGTSTSAGLGSAAPAVLGGLVVALSGAVIHLTELGRHLRPDGVPSLVGELPVAIGLLVVAGGLALLAVRVSRAS